MGRFSLALAALFMVVMVAVPARSQQAVTAEEYGMEMAVRSLEALCWYETLRVFPNTNTDAWKACTGQAKFQKKSLMSNPAFMSADPLSKTLSFSMSIKNNVLKLHASQYTQNCESFLTKSKAKPTADESDVMFDQGNDYPWKAFAYCIMNTLRKTHGDEAIEIIKNEYTASKKNWMATALDRENAERVRHGVEPLGLLKELNEGAQQWAEEQARQCKMFHSARTLPTRLYNGEETGENVAANTVPERDDAITALVAADGFYQEIAHYPYPDGFTGAISDPLFHKIGHFTQTVWKDSKYVGYGYAYNPNCPPGENTQYFAARYYPSGNIQGMFTQNIEPPKE